MTEQDPSAQQPPQQPYGQPPAYGYSPPGAGGYPQPGFPAQGYSPPQLPKHPQAQTSMVLGIIALAGAFTCLLPILLSPFAWYIGAKAKREMTAAPGRWSGQGEAQAGFIMGIIGTVILTLGLVLLVIIALGAGLAVYSEPSTY